jgi:hydroxymethylbilane synthase
MNMQTIRLGTRGSALARWQTEHIRDLLLQVWPDAQTEIRIFTTQGDKALDTPLPLVGGKGVFTAELEAALREGTIDLAVHSLKDLPTEAMPGLTIGAVPERGDAADALISRRGYTLDTLPDGAAVGTSSRRRAAQLLRRRPDLRIFDIRGNVDTRVRKALSEDGPYDAILLAKAGLERLGLLNVISQTIPFEYMLPAPGQAALAVQCRDEADSLDLLRPIHHLETALAVTAERAFLAGLGGGCAVPIAAYAQFADGFQLTGRVCSPDGSQTVEVQASDGSVTPETAAALGRDLAQEALARGAAAILGVQS